MIVPAKSRRLVAYVHEDLNCHRFEIRVGVFRLDPDDTRMMTERLLRKYCSHVP